MAGGGLAPPPARQAEPQIVHLGYVEGALWRLVLYPTGQGAQREMVPELQSQPTGHPHWDVVGRGDLLARLVYQAWRRGEENQPQKPRSSLLIP